MKKGIISLIINGLLIIATSTYAVRLNVVTLNSPNNAISLNITISRNDKIRLNIIKNGQTLLENSSLGLVINEKDIGKNAKITGKININSLNEQYFLYGNHPIAINNYNEATIPLKSGNINYLLVARAYEDGIGIRYIIKSRNEKTVNKDNTTWAISNNSTCFWAPFAYNYEELHLRSTFSEIPNDKTVSTPLTLKNGNFYFSFSEADCRTFPDMSFRKEKDYLIANFESNPNGFKITGDIVSSWRTVMITDNLTALVNSDLIMNLCDAPQKGYNFDWVKPGRVLWQWWSSGEPQLKDQQKWYDAAARLTWEYYLIDDGWRYWKQDGKNEWQCLKEVIDYGKSKGIKTIVWVNSEEMRTKEGVISYLKKVKEAGAIGIKIDFIPDPTPEVIQWYIDALEETYKLQLLCSFHGCAKPTGLRRTWEHELTREAIRGHEYHISRYERMMPQNQDVILPFTRLLAGPADYTPTAFVEKELMGYTWAHELAQAIVYTSPLTHFADAYNEYLNNPAEDLLRDMPTIWDETLALPCTEIGSIVAFARRKGNDWWIGVVNGDKTNEIKIPANFLIGTFMATTMSDSPFANNAFVREEKVINSSDVLNLSLRPGGGYVARFKLIR